MSHYLKMSLLFLFVFQSIKASEIDIEKFLRRQDKAIEYFSQNERNKYLSRQEKYTAEIYQADSAKCQEGTKKVQIADLEQPKEKKKYLFFSLMFAGVGGVIYQHWKPQKKNENHDINFVDEKLNKQQEEFKREKEKIRRLKKNDEYKEYFAQQEEIYQELVALGIPGVCPLTIDAVVAEEVLTNSSKEIQTILARFKKNMFSQTEKNIILHGISGTGKSATAQAISIKCKVPCLFFDAGSLSNTYMNSGIDNLNKIVEHAKKLEKKYGKPCIIIIDELEALTGKHVDPNNHEKNILRTFWQRLDKLSNSRVVVIGTMNRIGDVPAQLTQRTSMIEIFLPNQEQKEAILSHHLKQMQEMYNLAFAQEVTPAYLARQAKGFSNRDLKKLVERATDSVMLSSDVWDESNRKVMKSDFDSAIKQIKKTPARKLEQAVGTWRHTFKTNIRDPKFFFPAVGVIMALVFACNQIRSLNFQRLNFEFQVKSYNVQIKNLEIQIKAFNLQIQNFELQKQGQLYQKEGIELQKESLVMQRDGFVNQKESLVNQIKAMEQTQKNFDYQISFTHMAIQAGISAVFNFAPTVALKYFGWL